MTPWQRWANLTALPHPTAAEVVHAAGGSELHAVFESPRSALLYLGGNLILGTRRAADGAERAQKIILVTPVWRERVDLFQQRTRVVPAPLPPAQLFGVEVPCSAAAMRE